MVVTGNIPSGADYGVAFGEKYVLATLVQPGVLRCFCPGKQNMSPQFSFICLERCKVAPPHGDIHSHCLPLVKNIQILVQD